MKSNPSAAVVDDPNNKSSADDDDSSTSNAFAASTEEDSLLGFVWISICGYLIYRIIYYSYRIRMSSIDEYGPVIHEFDPYFNFRATEVREDRQRGIERGSNQHRRVFYWQEFEVFDLSSICNA